MRAHSRLQFLLHVSRLLSSQIPGEELVDLLILLVIFFAACSFPYCMTLLLSQHSPLRHIVNPGAKFLLDLIVFDMGLNIKVDLDDSC